MDTSSAVSDGAAAAESLETLKILLGKLKLEDILSAVLLLLICYLLARVLRRLFRGVMARSRLSENLQHFLDQALRFALDFIILLIVADSLGIPVTSLLAVFSLLGLALSLSLQSLLGNLISGVVLLTTRPFGAGDFIELKGVSGTVKQVALFQTQLDTVDNKLIYIPNSDVLSSTIVNYSGESTRRVDITFCASYDAPTETVRAAILECAASLPQVLAEPAAEVVVSGFEESNVAYTARLWVRSDDCIAVRDEMNGRILQYYRKHGVEMSYPRIVVRP
ncbi:MAG: mechanosensitive ion channel family protein [Oscillospiraceae bacterium]